MATERAYESDLDGNCEGCGLGIGFTKTHEPEDCIRALKEALAGAEKDLAEPVQVVLVLKRWENGSSMEVVNAFDMVEDAEPFRAAQLQLAAQEQRESNADIRVKLLEVPVHRAEPMIRFGYLSARPR